MRPIKFRGMIKKSKEWRIGSLLVDGNDYFIVVNGEEFEHIYPVYKDSVGQYTGIKDKNGREIYEGDLLNIDYYPKRYVKFKNGMFIASPVDKVQEHSWNDLSLIDYDLHLCEVIGNIHEDKHLLEGETSD